LAPDRFGFECPYPLFLLNRTEVARKGNRVAHSNIATAWGLRFECGLTSKDQTPDEEAPLAARKRRRRRRRKMKESAEL
jgi:hypothetical protein